MTTETIDEIRNELFIALVTIRKVRQELFNLTHSGQLLMEVHALLPMRRQLENVQGALDKAYSHV